MGNGLIDVLLPMDEGVNKGPKWKAKKVKVIEKGGKGEVVPKV